ncbi:MAG: DMT family transporter [Bosea sp. (in: a-proteobacteria)]
MSPLYGISLKIISTLAFTLMSAGIKLVAARSPVGQMIFCRSFFALIPLFIWLVWQGEFPGALKTQNLRGHLKRGMIGSTGMFAGFTALSFLPLPDAIAINYAGPLLVVVLAAWLLKEEVRFYRWTAVVIGFVGVLIMLSPHFEARDIALGLGSGPALGALAAMLGALCSAFATIEVRTLTQTEKTGAIVFYFMMLTSLLGLATSAFGWPMPSLTDAIVLVMIGILGGLGQILMTASYRAADASLVAPFEYTSMIWALAIGWFVFGELPVMAVLIGAAIVVCAGLFVIWRENKLGLLRRQSNEADPKRPV